MNFSGKIKAQSFRLFVILVSLSLIFSLSSCASMKMSKMGITPYPTFEEVQESKFSEEWIRFKPLSGEDINADFSNIEDMDWLEPIAKENKIVLVGETHNFQTIHNLANRIFFALNKYDNYSLILIEAEYSKSAFFDHYVGLTDDQEAKKFHDEAIYGMIGTSETGELLEHLRRWNKTHPERRIHIGCHDVEHDAQVGLGKILVPYLKKVDPSYDIDLSKLNPKTMTVSEVNAIIDKAKELYKKAKEQNVVGDYPFLTSEYMGNVMLNLESTLGSYMYEDYFYRQTAIVRNITNDDFFGKYFKNGKVMLYGGSYHTPTHFPYPMGGNFLREGSYLTYDFGPTKGKTYSIEIVPYAQKIGSMADFDLKNGFHLGSGYKNKLKKFQRALKAKAINPEEYYMFNWIVDDFDKLMFKAAFKNDHDPLLVEELQWDKFIEKAKGMVVGEHDFHNYLKKEKEDHDRYDALIFVPRSEIIKAIKK